MQLGELISIVVLLAVLGGLFFLVRSLLNWLIRRVPGLQGMPRFWQEVLSVLGVISVVFGLLVGFSRFLLEYKFLAPPRSGSESPSDNSVPPPPTSVPPPPTSVPPPPTSVPPPPTSVPPPPTSVPLPPPPPPPPTSVPPPPDVHHVPAGQEDYFEVEVLYATDRAVGGDPDVAFASFRGDGSLTYGNVLVSIPDSHEIGEIESPAWWNFWDRDDPSKYVLVLAVDRFEGSGVFAGRVQDLLSEAGRDDVLLFLHGYNVDFDEAAKRTGQLAYDLQFPGVPMFYSWPSRGELEGYPADEASVEWTTPHFREFLRFVLTEVGARRVHVIAHSMGNRALLRALAGIDRSALPPGAAELRQIVLAAPDIDAGVFRQLAAAFPGKAERITLFTSSRDKAIQASRTFHDYPRAGGAIIVVPGVDTVDASAVQTDFLSHSYFGDSILSDIFTLIRHELAPADRFGLRERASPDGVYWEFLPEAD